MNKRSTIKYLLITLITCVITTSGARAAGLTAEQILSKELLLNQLMSDIHLLQLDFSNHAARERLHERQVQINAIIEQLPEKSDDQETSDLLTTVQSLWPVISRHTKWLANLPEKSPPPEGHSLMRALAKLDRQLLLLRQKTLSNDPKASQQFRLLEHALLMQRMTREYLSLSVAERNAENTLTGRMQLRTMANYFDQRLTVIADDLKGNPHASLPLKQSRAAWHYISRSITRFPEQMVPATIVRYNDRIVKKLSSIQRML